MSKRPVTVSEFRSLPLLFQRARANVSTSPQPVGEVSLTQKEFKDQCDINHQIALYTRNGQPLPPWPKDFDYDQVQDINATYVDAISSIQVVEDAFEQLPAAVRSRFENDPLKMAAFLADQANLSEAYELGLVNNPPPASIPPAEQPRGGADAPPPSPPQEGE